MNLCENYSFAIMNGTCHVNSESIEFAYDQQWKLLERVFGKPSRRRAVLLALCLGVPISSAAISSFFLGFGQLGAAPLCFGLFLISGPLVMLFYEEYTYPEKILRTQIESIIASAPTGTQLGMFTITYRSDGTSRKTAFCLPYHNARQRAETYEVVLSAFVSLGVMDVND